MLFARECRFDILPAVLRSVGLVVFVGRFGMLRSLGSGSTCCRSRLLGFCVGGLRATYRTRAGVGEQSNIVVNIF